MLKQGKTMIIDFIPFLYQQEGNKQVFHLAALFNHNAISYEDVKKLVETGEIIRTEDTRYILVYESQAMCLLGMNENNTADSPQMIPLEYLPFSSKRTNDNDVKWLAVLFNRNVIEKEEVENIVTSGAFLTAPNDKFIITYLTQVLSLLDLPLPEEFKETEKTFNIEIGDNGARFF